MTACPALPSKLENGKIEIKTKQRSNFSLYEDQVVFECNEDYELSTQVSEFNCQSDGSWNSEDIEPVCLKSLSANIISNNNTVIMPRK